MLLYLRCCFANKAVLVAYSIFLPMIGIKAFALPGLIALSTHSYETCDAWAIVSFAVLVLTSFGSETQGSYLRTMEFLNRYGYDRRLDNWCERHYCHRAGHRLAIREWKKKQKKRPRL